jgi:heat shock protein HtpX
MFFNTLKTVALLAALSSLLMLIGGFFGGYGGMQFAFLFALIINGITYFYSEKIVLHMYKAQKLDATQHNNIYNMVQELSQNMHIPMPKLWLVNSPMANAFATGRNPHHASIAVTSSIINILDEDELRAVLAHELAHIKNRDVLVGTIAATLATAIGYLANMLQYMAFWGSFSNSRKRGNPFAMLIIAILMPIAATILQLALSRSREYLADETGAQCCKDPLALAAALKKLHDHTQHYPMNKNEKHKASTASLFIVHPFAGKSLSALFSTHPPVQERIARLERMYQERF